MPKPRKPKKSKESRVQVASRTAYRKIAKLREVEGDLSSALYDVESALDDLRWAVEDATGELLSE